MEFYHGGNRLSFGGDAADIQAWVFVDGEWYTELIEDLGC